MFPVLKRIHESRHVKDLMTLGFEWDGSLNAPQLHGFHAVIAVSRESNAKVK